MIHWGQLSRKTDVNRFARDDDGIPHISPTERRNFFASRSRSVYDTYRLSPPPLTPQTPTLVKVPLLAPDARHVLQTWFDRFAHSDADLHAPGAEQQTFFPNDLFDCGTEFKGLKD